MTARVPPVGPGDAVRARVPGVLTVFAETRATVLENGIVERGLKDLCARYAAEDDEVVELAGSGRLSGREQVAVDWAHAIAWDSGAADEGLWRRLHAEFTEAELVELGYAIAFRLGQSHWLRTLGLPPLA